MDFGSVNHSASCGDRSVLVKVYDEATPETAKVQRTRGVTAHKRGA